jgi:bacterioferritin
MANDFALDVSRIREEARKHMDDGAVTPSTQMDQEQIITLLGDVVATEIVCFLRYQQHALVAAGINRGDVVAEFTEHATSEMEHAMWAAERISQLGGSPDLSPEALTKRSHTEYRTFDDTDLTGMLRENLVAERIVIQSYQEIARWIGDRDSTTRRLIERILEQEEEHADDLADLLARVPKA